MQVGPVFEPELELQLLPMQLLVSLHLLSLSLLLPVAPVLAQTQGFALRLESGLALEPGLALELGLGLRPGLWLVLRPVSVLETAC